jgi:hypothetical protein
MSAIETPLDLYRVLFVPFPDDVKSTQSMGKKGRITFVEWYHYVARAWKEFPEGFTKEITKLAVSGDYLLCVVRITDKKTGLYMESTGSAPVSKGSENFGGAAAESEHQATKRAFAHFGLGLEMYMDTEDFQQADPDAEPPAPRTEPEPEQLQRMKQLVKVCDEADALSDLINTERAAVKNVSDKKFRIGLAIEVLEDAMGKEGLDVPDPS